MSDIEKHNLRLIIKGAGKAIAREYPLPEPDEDFDADMRALLADLERKERQIKAEESE